MGEQERYSILGSIAKGGMAQVYLGRMAASAGFSRLVAIKRLHDRLSEDRDLVAMLVDEARLTGRIRHTNVVDILDVVVKDGAFALVLEWVEGAAVSVLMKRARAENEAIPRPIVLTIMQGVLRGLAAAHEARSEDGQPLGIVHRDVSPQNVLVGVDGIPRIIDFGVAKGSGKLESTKPGEIQGKYPYMAPEQLMGRPVTAQADVYAAGVVMWELLAGRRLFDAEDERAVCAMVLQGNVTKPSAVNPDVPAELDEVALKATARDVSDRYFDAREMLAALLPFEAASEEEVGAWVRSLAADTLEQHRRLIEGSTPASARSLEALLSELTPPISSPAISASSPSIMPVPVMVPMPHEPEKRSPEMRWLVPVAICMSLALFGVVLAISISKSPPSRAATIVFPPAPVPPAEEEPGRPEPLPEPAATVTAPAVAVSASARPPHLKWRPRPLTPTKRPDPTDRP